MRIRVKQFWKYFWMTMMKKQVEEKMEKEKRLEGKMKKGKRLKGKMKKEKQVEGKKSQKKGRKKKKEVKVNCLKARNTFLLLFFQFPPLLCLPRAVDKRLVCFHNRKEWYSPSIYLIHPRLCPLL
jgi:hypothetical protein